MTSPPSHTDMAARWIASTTTETPATGDAVGCPVSGQVASAATASTQSSARSVLDSAPEPRSSGRSRTRGRADHPQADQHHSAERAAQHVAEVAGGRRTGRRPPSTAPAARSPAACCQRDEADAGPHHPGRAAPAEPVRPQQRQHQHRADQQHQPGVPEVLADRDQRPDRRVDPGLVGRGRRWRRRRAHRVAEAAADRVAVRRDHPVADQVGAAAAARAQRDGDGVARWPSARPGPPGSRPAPSTWILPESSWTDSLNVSVTRSGASGTIVPAAGIACPPARRARSPERPGRAARRAARPATPAQARGRPAHARRSTVTRAMLPDRRRTAMARAGSRRHGSIVPGRHSGGSSDAT